MQKSVALLAMVATLALGGGAGRDFRAEGNSGPERTHAAGAAKQRMQIVFTGPWSFAMDTAKNRIVAIAPDLVGHSSLYLRATGSLIETGGIYDVALTGVASGPASATPSFIPGQLGAGTLATLEGGYTGTPYILNLPMTNSIHAVYKDPMNHSIHFPVPKPAISPMFLTKVVFDYLVDSTEVEFVHHISAASTSSESLESDGVTDVGIDDDPDYSGCDYGAKGAFAGMTKLVGITHYVDFPDYDEGCYADDPQNPGTGRTATSMSHSSTAGLQAIQTNLLLVVGNMDSYLEHLKTSQIEEKDRPEIEKIQATVRGMGSGIHSWEPQGPNSTQKQDFVSKLKEIQSTVAHSSLSAAAREHLLALDEVLKPLSASGKNCKAPLLLLTVQ
jgi:hypothetical protein